VAIISAPVIASPDTSTLFHIEADSLDFTMGAVLSQMSTDNDKWYPAAYFSKSLSSVE